MMNGHCAAMYHLPIMTVGNPFQELDKFIGMDPSIIVPSKNIIITTVVTLPKIHALNGMMISGIIVHRPNYNTKMDYALIIPITDGKTAPGPIVIYRKFNTMIMVIGM